MLESQTLVPNHAGGVETGTFIFDTPAPDPDLPFLVVVADPLNAIEEVDKTTISHQ